MVKRRKPDGRTELQRLTKAVVAEAAAEQPQWMLGARRYDSVERARCSAAAVAAEAELVRAKAQLVPRVENEDDNGGNRDYFNDRENDDWGDQGKDQV